VVANASVNNEGNDRTAITGTAHLSISVLFVILVIIPTKQPVVIVFTFLFDPFDLSRLIFRFDPCINLALILIPRFDLRGQIGLVFRHVALDSHLLDKTE